MLKIQSTFSGFSVDNTAVAKQFYGEVLGLEFEDQVGGTIIKLPNDARAWMYPGCIKKATMSQLATRCSIS